MFLPSVPGDCNQRHCVQTMTEHYKLAFCSFLAELGFKMIIILVIIVFILLTFAWLRAASDDDDQAGRG